MAFLSSIFTSIFSVFSNQSFVSAFTILKYIGQWLLNSFLILYDFVLRVLWVVVRFVLGAMEVLEYIIKSFLGVGVSPADLLNQAKDMQFMDILVSVFRAIVAVAIVLLIVFTIYAIIKQEVRNAQNGFEGNGGGVGNDKKGILMRLFKSFMGMILLPLCMIFILVGVSAALTSFNNALKGPVDSTIASRVLASSTYDANRYRKYANANKRVPIVIEAYDAESFGADQSEELRYRIKTGKVQSILINTARMITENTCLPFENTLSYKNNKLTNSSNYGSYYESFVCTAEQYQVMADFVEYAELTGLTYYIKSMDEKDIDWKYVDSTTYDSEQKSLTIKYHDENDINKNGSTSDTYEITYQLSYNVTTPISNALDSIMAMLGVGEFGDNLYKVMERDEDFLNIVKWSTEKVLIKFSDDFDVTNPKTWTTTDQIIIYEFYHFSSNNTFAKYSLSDLKKGVELDALEITYRDYYAEAGAYSPERTITGVLINGSYYNTVKSTKLRDNYGNFYHILKTIEDVKFLNSAYTMVNEVPDAKVQLSLSRGFDINDPTTWTYTDQILVYEFYNFSSYNNTLKRDPNKGIDIGFSAYMVDDAGNGGVKFPVYKITNADINTTVKNDANYVLLNGTFYSVREQGGEYFLNSGSGNFLTEANSDAYIVYQYNFNFDGVKDEVTGIDSGKSSDTFIYEATADSNEEELSDTEIEKYSSFSLKFSANFNFKDPSTWTYLDYFLFYLYSRYPGIANSVDELKYSSLGGLLVKVRGSTKHLSTGVSEYLNGKIMYLVEYDNGTSVKRVYLDVDEVKRISRLLMPAEIDHLATQNQNYFGVGSNSLFINYELGGNLYNAETEYRTFNFSETFSESLPSTWTVEDLVLVMLVRKGYLPSVSEIQSAGGYNSLVYKIKDGANQTKYYKFSKERSTSGDTVIYLNENSVLNMVLAGTDLQPITFANIDEWLSFSALEFVAKIYSASANDFIMNFGGIAGSLYSEVSSSVLSIGQVIDKLVNENGFIVGIGNAFEIYDEVSKYTYVNQTFNEDDLSTWTTIDAAIYYITGRTVGRYSSYVIKKDGKNYFVVGNKALDISSANSKFKSTMQENNIITSTKSTLTFGGSSDDDIKNYVETNYSNLIFKTSDFLENNGESRLSFYTNSEFNYSNTETHNSYYVYDVLEAILKVYENFSGTSKTFRVYTDGADMFIGSTDKNGESYFISVGALGTSAAIRFIEQPTLTLNLSDENKIVFSSSGTYNAFENFDKKPADSKYSYLDSLIFNLTKNSDKRTYNIYSAGSKKYLDVDGTFIEYVSTDEAEITIATANSAYATEAHEYYLYSNFYSGFGLEPGTLTDNVVSDKTYTSKFSLNDISTWSPLNILLYEMGLIAADGITFRVKGDYVEASNGRDHYLRILDSATNKYSYILAEGIFEFLADDEDVIVSSDVAVSEMYLNLFLAKDVDAEGEFTDQSEYISTNYLTFNSNLETVLNTSTSVKQKSELSSMVLDAGATASTSEKWTWFDLVYYKLFGTFRTEENFEIYTNAYGATFIRLDVSSTVHKFVKISDILTLAPDSPSIKANATGKESYNFDLNTSSFNNLGIIAYNLTGVTSGEVSFIRLPKTTTTFGDKIFFIQSSSGTYFAACNLNEKVLTSGVSESQIKYITADGDELLSWNALDFLFKYVEGSPESREENSKVYTYGKSQFLKVGSLYINISKLNLVYDSAIDKNNLLIKGTNKKVDQMPKILSNLFESFAAGSSRVPALEAAGVSAPVEQNVKFSNGFVVDDISTWTLADFVIYYYFKEGYIRDSKGNVVTNFQDIVNNGGANAYRKCYVFTDTYGNSKIYDVIKFGDETEPKIGFNLINQEVFKELYGRKLIHYSKTITLNNVNVLMNLSTRNEKPVVQATANSFTYSIKADLMSNSFAYSNFYFFKFDSSVAVKSDLINVPSNIIDLIVSGNESILTNGTVNLKLSDGFDITNVNTWTVLDFIIIREASRSVNGNVFKGKNLESLKTNINRIDVLELNDQKYLYLNGAVYNITNYIKSEDGDLVTDSSNDFVFEAKINEALNVDDGDGNMIVSDTPIVTEGSVDNYDFRFMAKQINFLIIRETDEVVIKETDFKTPTTFSYTQKIDDVETSFYYTVDTRVSSNFEIDLSDTAKYPPDHLKISAIVRELNWPQKLMNDMFVIYPDLNWETLIATEGWIDTLGDFTSANASGNYITDENSANITAAGLVLSEFFLSVAKAQEYSYAKYEYTPIFDQEVIQALMLALAGEENYKTLVDQAKIFNDMFNVAFASVLDDIAAETGIEIVNGKVDNFTMSVYKAYLTTLMLSSDFGEYIYKLATRVYAEYTIYESLAYAGGDYAKYYAFVNDLVDENGEKVTSFKYGSFYDLVVYENSVLGNGSATFTFNYRRVYRALVDENATDEEIKASLENRSPNGINYASVYSLLNSRYSTVYSNGGSGKIGESDDLYCFMLDVYWSTVQRLYNQGTTNANRLPDYMKIYKTYVDGTMTRWSIIDSSEINATARDLQYYKIYEARLVLESLSLATAIGALYVPTMSSEFKGTDEDLESLQSRFENTKTDISLPINVLKKTFEGSSYYSSLLDDALSANIVERIKMVIDSPKGKGDSWEKIIDTSEKLRELLVEFGSVVSMGSGMTNQNGSKKDSDILDENYQKTYSALSKVTETYESYVSIQKKIDSMKKTSITFMLKQFGDNFQTEGFAFSLENRKYTLTTTTSPKRLAEYVFGGAYLEKFGVEPVYTDKGSAGIVEALIKYDHYDGMIKTKLSTFKVLREFVTSLADYTAKLYYISNFNDLAQNTSDSTLMTDYVYANSPFDENIQFVTTPEFLMIAHLALNSDIEADTLVRLVFGDTVRNLENMSTEGKDFLNDATYNSFVQVIKALDGQSSLSDISEQNKRDAIVYYLDFIMSDDYNSFGYYNYGGKSTPAERVHGVFKNVITYLITTEDASETSNENAVNLDGLNMKEFRLVLMQKLVEYKQNENETSAENASRYLALFDLISSQFTYYKYSGSGANDFDKRIGRTISFEHLSYKELDDGKTVPMYDETNYLFATFNIDKASRNMVLSLAGIANRPIEELINLEYNSLYEKNGNYDEANGDNFIVCTYDDVSGLYVPILARNTNGGSFGTDSGYAKYISQYHINPSTSYYNQENGKAVAQPIVAKGVITADLKPTAIKMEDYVVKFYRTDISATANLDEDALSVMRITQETQVIGFTKFVNRATSKKFSGENSQTMFIGQSDLSSFLNSDFSVYFVQITNAYNCTVDGQNAFNVLDTFSYFFAMSWLEYLLLALGFATIIPLLFKASIAAMQRIFDLIFLTLVGPIAISANSLNLEDSKQKDNTLFDKWRNYMTQSLLQAFGLVVGFNIYYILMSTIMGMTFVSAFTVSKIHAIGGMTFVSANMLNAVVKFLFVVSAASIVRAAGNLITRIITLGKVSDAFTSPISGDGFSNVKDVLNTMKKSFNNVKAAVTGQLLLEAKDAAIQELKEAIPGYQIAAKAAGGVRAVVEKARNRALTKALEAKGVPKSVAKKMVKEFAQETKKQRYLNEKRRVENANKFIDRLDLDDDAKKDIKFKDPKAPKEKDKPKKGKVKKKNQADVSQGKPKSSREDETQELSGEEEHSEETKEKKSSGSNMETKGGSSRTSSSSGEGGGSGQSNGESEQGNQGQKNDGEEQQPPHYSSDYSRRGQEEMRKTEEIAKKHAEQERKMQESDEAKAAANPALFALTHPRKAMRLWKEMEEEGDPKNFHMGGRNDKDDQSKRKKRRRKKDDEND